MYHLSSTGSTTDKNVGRMFLIQSCSQKLSKPTCYGEPTVAPIISNPAHPSNHYTGPTPHPRYLESRRAIIESRPMDNRTLSSDAGPNK